jgi:DNA-binding MarR family transcriptional regulator
MTSALTDHLGYWLRTVSNHVSHSFALKLQARDVTVAEWVLMRALFGHPPTAPSRLAAEMGVTRGAVTKLADRLIAKAFIVRKADGADARAQTLALTQKGARLVPQLAALADRNDADCFAALSKAERKTLEALLKQIAARARLTAPPLD